MTHENYDVAVIGAGAAGLFCAAEAARRGKRVLVIDHAEKIGEKIRISGGGRCNFTNIHTTPDNFLSRNPKFCISALSRFTPQDFVDRVNRAGVAWHEKKLGQLFCDDSAGQIIRMLTDDCAEQGVTTHVGTTVAAVRGVSDGFALETTKGAFSVKALVIATGGKSIPKIGATGFGYDIATQFGVPVVETRPGLAPLTFEGAVKDMAKALAGVSVEAAVSADPASGAIKGPPFREGFLFTHRGLSGPSILQISNYWREGARIIIDLVPSDDIYDALRDQRARNGRLAMTNVLGDFLPKRLVTLIATDENWTGNLADWSDTALRSLAERLHQWRVTPSGSEGYRTAEVTLGGVDTKALNSRTMAVKGMQGLYFIGEVVDVTGWLGGYNFQWAWSSGYAAGSAIGETV